MSDLIQNVINQALSDGARPAKFKAQIIFPAPFSTSNAKQLKHDDKMIDAMCKSTMFANKFNETIMIKHKGRDVPVPGQEKFGHVIAVTLYLEENHRMKNLFYQWMQGLNYETYTDDVESTVWDLQLSDVSASFGTLIITQLAFDNDKETVEYTFHNIFPKELDGIALSAESVGAISEYACSFSYSHYTIKEKADASNSNDVANSILGAVQDTANGLINKAIGYIPGLDSVNSAAASANAEIQEAGKSVGSTVDEWLG